jgi:amino acid permease
MKNNLGGFMQAHLPYSQVQPVRGTHTRGLQVRGPQAQELSHNAYPQPAKIWRNTLMMVVLFVLTYWLALYWLLPSVGTVAAGIKAPIVCLVFWLGCSFGDRAAKYRRR